MAPSLLHPSEGAVAEDWLSALSCYGSSGSHFMLKGYNICRSIKKEKNRLSLIFTEERHRLLEGGSLAENEGVYSREPS